jgi:hypothetical protein
MAMKLLRLPLITTSIAILSVAFIQPADSRPYPDQSGVCYFFRGQRQELTQSCVISAGYGAGGHYAVLQWPDGVNTRIIMTNSCPNEDYDENGFCGYTVDNYEAVPYQRNVFLETTTIADEDNLDCYRVVATGNSVCYRFNQ